MKKYIAFLRHLSEVWDWLMYVVMIVVTLMATQLSIVGFLLTILGAIVFAVLGEILINRALAQYTKGTAMGLMSKTLTEITEDGDYSLNTENLYEAVAKLGYIEHELKGDYDEY